jgi:beta-phosphoglucomutase
MTQATTNTPARGFLFDLDGTLIDSMPHHHTAWVAWHARRGMAIDEEAFFAATAGRANEEIFADLLPGTDDTAIARLVDEKESLYRDHARPSLALISGAESFVQRARAAGCKLAVCTASTLPNMALAFERFGINRWVDTVVSPADVSSEAGAHARRLRGKPHPDIFLEAARRLGLTPSECLVFEDAPLGVEAARRAGMQAVALTTTLGPQAFAGFDNLVAVGADFLAAAVADVLASLPQGPAL